MLSLKSRMFYKRSWMTWSSRPQRHCSPSCRNRNRRLIGCFRSERLSAKPTAKLPAADKARVVLLKKLDLPVDDTASHDARKQRLLSIFKGPVPEDAVEAMEDLISDVHTETTTGAGLPAAA